MLEALAAPFKEIKFIPTGGISANNMAGYLRLPMVFAVAGSWLATSKMIAAQDFEQISALTSQAVAIVLRERKKGAGK